MSQGVREEAVTFGGDTQLVGIVSDPPGGVGSPADGERPAFLFLNAGLTHRVGPNGLYVRLARQLAAAGFVAMRFDFSGLGDSPARRDNLPPGESILTETTEAMDLLARTRGVKRFCLLGICSGATISFLMAQRDERVAGAVLINAQAHLHGLDPDLSDHLRARTISHHSWRIALRSSFRAKNLRKALGGQLDPRRILKMMVAAPLRVIFRPKPADGKPLPSYDAAAELRAVTDRGVQLFHLYSEGDEGLDYFQVVLGDDLAAATSGPNTRYEVLPGTNHVFTLRWSQERLVQAILEWAQPFGEARG